MDVLRCRGFEIRKGYLDRPAQEEMVASVREIVRVAPLVRPETRFGQKMSVRISAAGEFGWVSDRRGYRYERYHPSGVAWPAIPEDVLQIWHDVTRLKKVPQCCLVNYYTADARMGLHQDRDEADFIWPVLSISLGNSALFRMGNKERGGSTESVWLDSGDVVVMGGDARLCYHGVDRIKPGSSTLLKDDGRINLTLRVVT